MEHTSSAITSRMWPGSGRLVVQLLASTCLTAVLTLPGSAAYKNVVFMHGLLAGPTEFTLYNDLIQQFHPGTPVTQVSLFSGMNSLVNLWEQVSVIGDSLRAVLTNSSSEGTVLVCYSQGGVVCRGLLSTMEHNVDTFIALSSPLAGQFGITGALKKLLPGKWTKDLYKFLYTKLGQTISLGNYWNDPFQQELFRNTSEYLAVLNNQSVTVHTASHKFRANFLRLKNLVLVGGPDDEVITPWQSSQFGMYNLSGVVQSMEQQEWYVNDAFGLQTLNSKKRIHQFTLPGFHHHDWYWNKEVFETCLKPWLS